MIYNISLKQAGLILGTLLLIIHVIALIKPQWLQEKLKQLPRSRFAGTVLLIIAAIWAFLVVWNMDLGEFSPLRNGLLIVIGVLTFTTWKFVPEFLAVRAFGMISLLAAEPLLEAAFLQPQASRLLVVSVAYLWIIAGLFWVGMPFLMRDQIQWISARPSIWKLGAIAGIVYSLLLLYCSIMYY